MLREKTIALVWWELRGDRLMKEGTIALVGREMRDDRLVWEGAIEHCAKIDIGYSYKELR